MLQTLHCIALRTIKYDDRRSILTAWSRENGRVSMMIQSGAGREAARRRALLMPMSLFEGISDLRPGKEITGLRDVRPMAVFADLHAHPVKSVLCMFLADFLETVLRPSPPDKLLTDYICDSVAALDGLQNPTAIANFHLYFLFHLGRFIGIEPDESSWQPGSVFDTQEGIFRTTAPLHNRYLEGNAAYAVFLLSRMHPENLHTFRFTRNERNAILDNILAYYTLHHTPVSNLTSLEVARAILG